MNDLNLCQFIGRVGREPEIRYTADQRPIANVSIACGWKSKDKEDTEWVRIVAFGKLAEIIDQHLLKGALVYFSGRLQTRKWQDKDGNDRYSTEIVADRMQMLARPRSDEPRQQRSTITDAEMDALDSDDIPF